MEGGSRDWVDGKRKNEPGLGIRSSVFLAIRSFFCEWKSDSLVKKSESLLSLFCHERPERIAHGRSFVKSYGTESLKSLFKSERMSKERYERFLVGHTNVEKLSKTYEKYDFFERIIHIALFKERR